MVRSGVQRPGEASPRRRPARWSADGWPTDAAGLRRLPGIGPYTAAAVASIAFGEPIAAVDTNVRRVLSRWEGTPLAGGDLDRAADAARTGDAGEWNQAVMDLGATLCRPKPRCEVCPVTAWCADPAVYLAPPRQAAFAGSDREVARCGDPSCWRGRTGRPGSPRSPRPPASDRPGGDRHRLIVRRWPHRVGTVRHSHQ